MTTSGAGDNVLMMAHTTATTVCWLQKYVDEQHQKESLSQEAHRAPPRVDRKSDALGNRRDRMQVKEEPKAELSDAFLVLDGDISSDSTCAET